jgi:hypothetical protein
MAIIQLTLAETVEKLHKAGMKISKESLGEGIKQGAFTFGNAFRGANGGTVYQPSTVLLICWLAKTRCFVSCTCQAQGHG